MTLDYITIPTAIFRLKNLNLRQKILLGLIISFNEKGLKKDNESLAEILDVLPSRISDLLCDMERKDYIDIKNRQSQHRTIYLREKSKVGDILLTRKIESKDNLLTRKRSPTYEKNRNIIKVSKSLSKNRERAHFQKPTPAEVSEYAKTIGYTLDGEYFCDTYEARGWMVGRSMMRDWRAAVRTWKRREGNQNGNRNSKVGTDSAKPNPVARPVEFVR
jgi:hypothetical protein